MRETITISLFIDYSIDMEYRKMKEKNLAVSLLAFNLNKVNKSKRRSP